MQYRPIRFPTGEVRATTAALANVSKEKLICLVNRHIRGNWGDTCMADQKANEQAIRDGDRILSWYQISGKIRILIITEQTVQPLRSCWPTNIDKGERKMKSLDMVIVVPVSGLTRGDEACACRCGKR